MNAPHPARCARHLPQLAEAHLRPVDFASLAHGDDEELLGQNLLAAICGDQVSAGATSRDIETDVPEVPLAFASARAQAARGSTWVTNLWHRVVELGPQQRALLQQVDGSRSRAALLLAMPELNAQALEVQLSFLAEHALLVRAPSGTPAP